MLQCKKRHVAICPQYENKGVCSKGKSCPYPHPKLKKFRKDKYRSDETDVSEKNKCGEFCNIKDFENDQPKLIEEGDGISGRYYSKLEYEGDEIRTRKRKNDDDFINNLTGSDWLKKRPRVGDLPGFIPLDTDTDSNLS